MRKRRQPMKVTLWSEEMSGMTSTWMEEVHFIRYTDGRFGLKGDSPWDDSGCSTQYELRYRSPRFRTADEFMKYLQEAGQAMGIEHKFEPLEIREMLPELATIAPALAEELSSQLDSPVADEKQSR